MDPCALGNILLIENECELENEQTIHVEGSIILDASSLEMQNNASEQNELKELICERFVFDEIVFKRVADNGFNMDSLLVATELEINELFPAPLLGTRAKFKFHLNVWRKNPPKNISEACKNWIESNYLEPNSRSVHSNISSTSSSHRSFENDSILFDNSTLKELLSQTERGQSMLNFYDEKKKHLDEADIQTDNQNILEKWRLFKHPLGHTLVDIDYNILKPNNQSQLFKLWPSFIKQIVPVIKNK